MVAFAVDVGYLSLARTEIQSAADAGAIAGAIAIPDGPSAVRALAQTGAQANEVAASPVVIVPHEDVELGTWDDKTLQFTLLTGAAEANANSVRVTCRRLDSRGNPVSLFFARAFGTNSSEMSAVAVARRRLLCSAFIGIDSSEATGKGRGLIRPERPAGDRATASPTAVVSMAFRPRAEATGLIHKERSPGSFAESRAK